MQPGTLILGLGNPLRGDDGIGPSVVKELAHRNLPEEVTLIDGGTGGLDLLRLLERWKRVVIVDAADVGRDPGECVRFTPEEVRLVGASAPLSLHHAGLSEVLTLAEALDLHLPEMVIFGVQPAEIGWKEGLSPAVAATLSTLADAVLQEIEGEDCAEDTGDRG
ncbi:MAG: hydrogenase maturation protease [Anaerolineae bacterium]|jgi:hydrogenase maturation protease